MSLFPWSKKNRREQADNQAAVDALKKQALTNIEEGTKAVKDLNDKLEKEGGVTFRIYIATGGGRR